MTAEYVSVPRELVLTKLEEILANKPENYLKPGVTVYQVTDDEVIEFARAILSRATPLVDDRVDVIAKMVADRVGNGMREKYIDLAYRIIETCIPSTPRVVTDEDVERACESYEGPYNWEFQLEAVKANTRISMRAALESFTKS